MPKFTIGVTRIGYGHHDIEVVADSKEEAEQEALDTAGNYLYNENHSKYEIDYVIDEEEEST
jgi:hypothetical protein